MMRKLLNLALVVLLLGSSGRGATIELEISGNVTVNATTCQGTASGTIAIPSLDCVDELGIHDEAICSQ